VNQKNKQKYLLYPCLFLSMFLSDSSWELCPKRHFNEVLGSFAPSAIGG
jgi:hypothetical protein